MKLWIALVILWLCSACIDKAGKKETNPTNDDAIQASVLSGKELALSHCSRCHQFVAPGLLPKSSWKNDVLPAMGHRMGIFKGANQPDSLFESGIGGQIVRKAGIFPSKPILANADWDKIVDYYLTHSPDSISPPVRSNPIRKGLKHFRYKKASFGHQPPLTTMVKILPENRGIVFSDGKRDGSKLTFLKPDLTKDYSVGMATSPIHYHERNDTLFLTTAGKTIFPHNAPEGVLQVVTRQGARKMYTSANVIISNMQRPVFMAYGDLNQDGLEDIVACEYGNHTGKLVWFENQGQGNYTMWPLRSKPGAITAIIKDTNSDGFKDIIVLMAQGDEGIFLYENTGNGSFVEKRLLTFSPLNGSQYIELADFNQDGHDDIIYTCGDNADQTPILKDYHGIYIFLNDGYYGFGEPAFFYPLNGAYKAIPRDFDLDGDLDIAAISFFPDYAQYPEESFVYLENTGDLNFEDYSFPEATDGRWIVMDVGDIDGDGDLDLALGSFVYFLAKGDTTGLGQQWLTQGPSVVVLENMVR